MGWMSDETGLDKCAANYVPLTPLSHLQRARTVFADRTALVYGDIRLTYAEYHARCSRLASALVKAGVQPGDVVATLLPNIPAQSEAAFGVPACGAVLNTINTRLGAFAQAMGDTPPAAIIGPQGEPTLDLLAYRAKHGLSLDWIVLGEGPQYRTRPTAKASDLAYDATFLHADFSNFADFRGCQCLATI